MKTNALLILFGVVMLFVGIFRVSVNAGLVILGLSVTAIGISSEAQRSIASEARRTKEKKDR